MIGWIKEKFNWLREKLKGWKTVIIGSIAGAPLALLEVLEQLQIVDPSSALPPPWGQRVALAIALLMILLRFVTTGSVGAKDR